MKPPTITLSAIEEGCRIVAKDHAALKELVEDLNRELATIVRRKISGIKRAAEQASASQTALLSMVEGAPELFVKPKTFVLHGIKVGFAKNKGSIEWDDDESVVKRIRKCLPDMAEALIISHDKPSADALRNLPATDLARLGVSLVNDKDVAVVKVTADEVDKFVSKMIDDSLKQAAA